MQTTRIISNISYNTMPYFKETIDALLDRGVIDWAYWIQHKADEDDEKEHIHFVLKPSRRIDTTALRNEFNELDEDNEKPLTCTMRWFATNSMDDWLLYAIHHQGYLSAKGQYRRYAYEWKDINTTDRDALRNDIANIDLRKYLILQWLEDAARKDVPFFQLVQDGFVPISQRTQYEYQYKALKQHLKNEEWIEKRIEDNMLEYYQGEIDNPF